MDLERKFEEGISSRAINIIYLKKEKLYPIVHAKRVTTKYGPTVLLTNRDSESCVVQIFLPKRYCAVISVDGVDKINNSAVSLNLLYKVICETSKSYLLGIAY